MIQQKNGTIRYDPIRTVHIQLVRSSRETRERQARHGKARIAPVELVRHDPVVRQALLGRLEQLFPHHGRIQCIVQVQVALVCVGRNAHVRRVFVTAHEGQIDQA